MGWHERHVTEKGYERFKAYYRDLGGQKQYEGTYNTPPTPTRRGSVPRLGSPTAGSSTRKAAGSSSPNT